MQKEADTNCVVHEILEVALLCASGGHGDVTTPSLSLGDRGLSSIIAVIYASASRTCLENRCLSHPRNGLQ